MLTGQKPSNANGGEPGGSCRAFDTAAIPFAVGVPGFAIAGAIGDPGIVAAAAAGLAGNTGGDCSDGSAGSWAITGG